MAEGISHGKLNKLWVKYNWRLNNLKLYFREKKNEKAATKSKDSTRA